MLTRNLFTTEWRKSDPTICTGVMRLAECGCGTDATKGLALPDAAKAISEAVIPPPPDSTQSVAFRGFPLGTWSGADQLPDGCRYTAGKESNSKPSQTQVVCKLTAQDVLDGASDLKDLCRAKYGNNVVVHVPLPAAAISCMPPAGAMCSTQPWVVTE
jgi:hypothetical protein